MGLNAGDFACTNGLSKRIYDYWTADTHSGFSDPLTTAQADCVRAMCYAIARAVVDEIVADAVVHVGVSSGTVT